MVSHNGTGSEQALKFIECLTTFLDPKEGAVLFSEFMEGSGNLRKGLGYGSRQRGR